MIATEGEAVEEGEVRLLVTQAPQKCLQS
jgi:hypothetical protein